MNNKDVKIAVIELGYVELPLARLFSTKYTTIGFDINQAQVKLMSGRLHARSGRRIAPVCYS